MVSASTEGSRLVLRAADDGDAGARCQVREPEMIRLDVLAFELLYVPPAGFGGSIVSELAGIAVIERAHAFEAAFVRERVELTGLARRDTFARTSRA